MADKRRRSKRQSTSKKDRPRKGFTLYLCHNLDYEDLASTLDRAGIRYKRHREFFSGMVEDEVLLPKVGRHRWILITYDQKQRTRLVEKELIKRFRIREFVFTGGSLPDPGALLVKASKRMRAICRTTPGPFVYAITQTGNVHPKALE